MSAHKHPTPILQGAHLNNLHHPLAIKIMRTIALAFVTAMVRIVDFGRQGLFAMRTLQNWGGVFMGRYYRRLRALRRR